MRNDNHFPLKASTDFLILVDSAEKILSRLQYEFLQHKTRDVVEFEVIKPGYFRVVVERRKDPQVSNIVLPSIKPAKGTYIDVWLEIDQGEDLRLESLKNARILLKNLVDSLPEEPWKGMRFRESGRERKKWVEIIE
ncbi:MAG: hypothetical protein OK439_07680 [Thaumarchaeota archaeon]|nr:hypothetical protein [Nitrososphaerota archaeon]